MEEEYIIDEICKKVLGRVTPKAKERKETLQFSSELVTSLAEELKIAGIEAGVCIQGSIAKDTWLSGDKDIDVFIALPKTSGKNVFSKVLEVVKAFVGENWIEAYAEHPYIEAEIKNHKIDFVPCFSIEKAEEAGSSVDRTPLHTIYVKTNLSQQAKDQVRLLKQYMRGIGTYGAEIKVKGLSGYLCELLVLHYKSFLGVLNGIAKWRFGQVVDLERFYSGRVDETKKNFNAPLVVIDPVDANRNVAAAVSKDRLGELIIATKIFLSKPDSSFFFPPETTPLKINIISEKIAKLKFDLIFIVVRNRMMVPDVLWGQLYKTAQALRRHLTQNDFQILRNTTWSDEKGVTVFVFELEAVTVPITKKHLGPPADSSEALSFIEKYVDNGVVEFGPWIEDGRCTICVRRLNISAAPLLRRDLRWEIENIGVASGLKDSMKNAEIYVNNEVKSFYISYPKFAEYLTDFLQGRPKWLK